ncbi:polysaccharide biosynthesis/export family protein [Methylocaldum szegediense]|jgi:polysaccharide export outer membrane protein|uniref:Polysaccharide biosynthesis/export protein n=1 Tax=Methylocaldum szegediense TaxID=73780 RepID=A0ABM9I894_9GAMM|nr:polysaccharide biosynthesis/export family protein [Methylocaldum szegediense]CAI8955130.1 polysaccharide biosynthesis/export protein [Methylocaldum szegediense]
MKKGFLVLALTARFTCPAFGASTPDVPADSSVPVVPSDYVVDAGDVLEISVWKEDGLTKQALVRPDGGITFPLIGDLQVGGQTIHQIRSEITRKLGEYFAEPEVSVSLVNLNHKIYVIGRVNKPGEFVTPNRVSVMQALSMAGGLTPFADDDAIKIIRRIGGKEVALPFDYDAVASGKSLEQNILLQRGDVVVVP